MEKKRCRLDVRRCFFSEKVVHTFNSELTVTPPFRLIKINSMLKSVKNVTVRKQSPKCFPSFLHGAAANSSTTNQEHSEMKKSQEKKKQKKIHGQQLIRVITGSVRQT
jgi:hypothetical protein